MAEPDNPVAPAQTRRHIQMTPGYPFCDAVLVGNALYLSGRIGLDASRQRVPDDIDTEARNVMDDVAGVLRQAGMSMEDLVQVQVFCSDVSLWERFNAVYRTYFNSNLPARSFIGSGQLLFGARFEVQGLAIKRS